MEGSHSGLVHHLGKVAYLNGYREFESLPLRQTKKSHFMGCFYFSSAKVNTNHFLFLYQFYYSYLNKKHYLK